MHGAASGSCTGILVIIVCGQKADADPPRRPHMHDPHTHTHSPAALWHGMPRQGVPPPLPAATAAGIPTHERL